MLNGLWNRTASAPSCACCAHKSASHFRGWPPRPAFSTALLSKLETDRMIPTLPTLATISRVYGVGMSYFFAEPAQHTISITRKADLQGSHRSAEAVQVTPLNSPAEEPRLIAQVGRVSAQRRHLIRRCLSREQRARLCAGRELAVRCGRAAGTARCRRLRLYGERNGAGLERGRKTSLPRPRRYACPRPLRALTVPDCSLGPRHLERRAFGIYRPWFRYSFSISIACGKSR